MKFHSSAPDISIRDHRAYELAYALGDGMIEESEFRHIMKHDLGFDELEIDMRLKELKQ
jgi:hypothetical protein